MLLEPKGGEDDLREGGGDGGTDSEGAVTFREGNKLPSSKDASLLVLGCYHVKTIRHQALVSRVILLLTALSKAFYQKRLTFLFKNNNNRNPTINSWLKTGFTFENTVDKNNGDAETFWNN